jgi:hypothetical protein
MREVEPLLRALVVLALPAAEQLCDHRRHVPALEGCGCGYDRDSKRVDFGKLQERRPIAHEHAGQRHERHGSTPDAIERNPWTSVNALVDDLFRNTAT